MNKPNGKVFFDVDYMGHNIKVLNTWKHCSLIIDDVVNDTYKSVIAFNFTLKGTIVLENETVEIAFEFRNGFPRAKLLLSANGQPIATGKIFM